jgi:hypothetical protein
VIIDFWIWLCILLVLFTLLAGIAELWEKTLCTCRKGAIDPWCRIHGAWADQLSAEDEGKPAEGKAR